MQGFDKLQSQNNSVEAVDTSTINIIKPGHTRDPVCCNCACISSDVYEACSNNLNYNISGTLGQPSEYVPQDGKGIHFLLKANGLQSHSIETLNTETWKLSPTPVYEEQYVKGSDEAENITVCESVKTAKENIVIPVWEQEPYWESAASFETHDNSFDVDARDLYLQALDLLRELEVEEKMKPGSQSTIVFDPCENTNQEVQAKTEMQNRIQALEERILRLESEILKLEEINKKLKSRDIIPLNGSMATETCCGCSR